MINQQLNEVFAFMWLDLDGITDEEAKDRLLRRIQHLGLNADDFWCRKYDYLPERYRDSFSLSFVEAASHLDTSYSLMVASRW